jgi:predicted transposase/invertase (TIGR01784 family)
MAAADQGSKWLIGASPEAWAQWALDDPAVQVETQLSTEFQHLTRLSDSLLRVSRGKETFLVLTEVQLRPDRRMPRRMRAYAALAEEKYDLQVYPIVFQLLPVGGIEALPASYHSELLGLLAHQDYRVIKAWEIEAETVLAEENLALLPFVPLMAGADEGVIRRGVSLLRARQADERLETILGLFASFVLDIETIQQIVRWDMNILRESPWYQEILEEGLKQGREEGREEGILQGQREAILNFLRIRFYLQAETNDALTQRLAQIQSVIALQTLVVAAAEAETLANFIERLDEVAPLATDEKDR